MYLPNKITDMLSKISKSYIAEYNKGKISSVSIGEEDIRIEASDKGYCISIKGRDIHLDNLQKLEPLLLKMGAIKSNNNIKKEPAIRDNLIEIFSKNRKNFSVEYKLGKTVSIKMENPNLVIRKNSVGYLLIVNNEKIAIDNLSSLRKLLQKMSIIDKDKVKKKQDIEEIGFEQLMLDLKL